MTAARTKTKAETNADHASATNAAPVVLAPQKPAKGTPARAAGAGPARPKPATAPLTPQERARLIEEAAAAAKAKPRPPKPPDEKILRQYADDHGVTYRPPKSSDRCEVLKALAHGADGKCPAGVDWHNVRSTAEKPAPFLEMPSQLQSATRAATQRAVSYLNHIGALTVAEADMPNVAKVPACGWWWCGQKLKPEQWADLRAALKILQNAGVDPNGGGVASVASTYAEQTAWRQEWPKYEPFHSFITKVPSAVADLRAGPSAHLLCKMNLAWWAGHGAANPPDRPLQLFLNKVYDPAYWNGPTVGEGDVWVKGTPALAAAILHFFGLGRDGERLKALKHRIEVAWGRPGELGWGRPGDPNGRRK